LSVLQLTASNYPLFCDDSCTDGREVNCFNDITLDGHRIVCDRTDV